MSVLLEWLRGKLGLKSRISRLCLVLVLVVVVHVT